MIEFIQWLDPGRCTRQSIKPTWPRITKIPTSHDKTCTTARLVREPNKVEARRSSEQVISLQIPWLPCCENFDTRFRDPVKTDQSRSGALCYVAHSQQRFFKLCTSLPIHRRRSPVIRPMNFVPIASKIDHLRPERQYTSAPAYNSGASYGLDCEALCEESIYCQHSFGAIGHAPFLVS